MIVNFNSSMGKTVRELKNLTIWPIRPMPCGSILGQPHIATASGEKMDRKVPQVQEGAATSHKRSRAQQNPQAQPDAA